MEWKVIHVIDRSKKQFGNNFYRIFKSITIDNASEFRNVEMLEGALSDKDNQVELYYCSSVPILWTGEQRKSKPPDT